MKWHRRPTRTTQVQYHLQAEHIPPHCRALIQVPPSTTPEEAMRLRAELDRRHPGNDYLIVACARIIIDHTTGHA